MSQQMLVRTVLLRQSCQQHRLAWQSDRRVPWRLPVPNGRTTSKHLAIGVLGKWSEGIRENNIGHRPTPQQSPAPGGGINLDRSTSLKLARTAAIMTEVCNVQVKRTGGYAADNRREGRGYRPAMRRLLEDEAGHRLAVATRDHEASAGLGSSRPGA